MKKSRNKFITYTSILSVLSGVFLISNYALAEKVHTIQEGYNGIDLAIALIGFTLTNLILTILNFKFSKPSPNKLHYRLLPILILFITFAIFLTINLFSFQ